MQLGSMGLILGDRSFTGRGGYGVFMDFHNLGIHCWLEMFSLFIFVFLLGFYFPSYSLSLSLSHLLVLTRRADIITFL